MALYCRIKGVENSLMGAFNFSDHYSFTEGQRFNIALKCRHGRSAFRPPIVLPSLPIAVCLLLTAYCLLLTAYCFCTRPNELRSNGTLVVLSWPENSATNRVLYSSFFRNSR